MRRISGHDTPFSEIVARTKTAMRPRRLRDAPTPKTPEDARRAALLGTTTLGAPVLPAYRALGSQTLSGNPLPQVAGVNWMVAMEHSQGGAATRRIFVIRS